MSKSKFLFIFSASIITGLLAAGIVFAWTSPSGNPTLGSGALYYSGGNVGIGTATPGAKLDVAGGARISQLLDLSGINYIHKISGHNFVQGDATMTYFYGGSGGVQIRKSDNSVSLVQVLDNGNVGIGTTGPSYPLHLYKAAAETGALLSWGATNIYLSHGGWGIGAGKFGIGNGSVPQVVIDTIAGNVGIGTTSPGQKLTVAGTIESTSGGIKFPDGTIQVSAATAGTNYWTLSGSSLYPNQTSYNLGVGTASLDSNYKITVSGGGIKAESASQPAGYFSSASGYGLIVNSGNVGIGTTSPGQKLTVAGAIEATGGFKFPDATTQTTAFLGNANTVGWKSAGTTVIYSCPQTPDCISSITPPGIETGCVGQLSALSTCMAAQSVYSVAAGGMVCTRVSRDCAVAGYLLAP